MEKKAHRRTSEHFRGCLVGGAVGDALGGPVEFLRHAEIMRRYGEQGISDLQLGPNGFAEITDDTQMTFFTAEGVLRGYSRSNAKGMCYPPSVIYYAYQRWLVTQGYPRTPDYDWVYDGFLLDQQKLYAQRSPGSTCLNSLRNRVQFEGIVTDNDSKGCGGVMRVAPVGLSFEPDTAFEVAVAAAGSTHGHPSGYLSAGALAYLIARIMQGKDLEFAVFAAIQKLNESEESLECVSALRSAYELAPRDIPDLEAISQLGEGWVGEEALAIAVFCALRYQDDFKKAVTVAVNHDGDSDSTGAITGNILGAYLAMDAIPENWINAVELQDVAYKLADDLLLARQGKEISWDLYPGY